jgi:hypothetical protein
MSIPPFDLALRRRIPPGIGRRFTRLMAEYARRRRCVRRAAEGFSPRGRLNMLRRKDRRELNFAHTLESGARSFQVWTDAVRKIVPEKNNGRIAMYRRNESFFEKNGRKQGIFFTKFFEIAFARGLMYCIMVVCATRHAARTF